MTRAMHLQRVKNKRYVRVRRPEKRIVKAVASGLSRMYDREILAMLGNYVPVDHYEAAKAINPTPGTIIRVRRRMKNLDGFCELA